MKPKASKFIQSKQSGFTLIELLLVVATIGLVSMLLSPTIAQTFALRSQAQDDLNHLNSMKITQALSSLARLNNGQIPAELAVGNLSNGTTVNYPLFDTGASDPLTLALQEALSYQGLSPQQALTDGVYAEQAGAENARVYRVISSTLDTPLFGASGPVVTLEVQRAALYMRKDANEASLTDALAITADSFNPVLGDQIRTAFMSTEALQRRMLLTTTQRLDRLREAIQDKANQDLLSASVADQTTTNFNPGTTSANAAQGSCHENWIDLSVTSLSEVGLSSAEHGVTAWGKPIWYCPNLNDGSSVWDEAPFYRAIRFHKDVATTEATAVSETDNVILTF